MRNLSLYLISMACLLGVEMYLALRNAKVPAELHVYASGGHGFGLRATEHPCTTWPKRCEEWLRDQKILTRATARP